MPVRPQLKPIAVVRRPAELVLIGRALECTYLDDADGSTTALVTVLAQGRHTVGELPRAMRERGFDVTAAEMADAVAALDQVGVLLRADADADLDVATLRRHESNLRFYDLFAGLDRPSADFHRAMAAADVLLPERAAWVAECSSHSSASASAGSGCRLRRGGGEEALRGRTRLRPGSGPLRAHQLRSVALRGLGHHASAAAAARQAVKLDPENPSPLVTLVQALLSQNTVASRRQAHRAADRALRLAPERSDVRWANARVHARLRDTGKARGFLHSALADDPTDTNAQLDLAVLDIRRMRPTRAAWRLAAIAAGDPTSPLGLPALQSVAALWLRYVCAAVSVLYALAVPVGAAPIPDPVRIPAALGLAAAA